jgi:uncharacterized protein YgiM (DUF1202 family)
MLTATLAEEAAVVPQEQAANSKNAAIGEINGDNVEVRSAAGENYYPTMKLTKGQKVTVVGEKFGWLKIVPPDGSFCYVAKAYMDKGAGETATANRDNVNVRAGSVLNTLKTTVVGKLDSGQPAKVLGEIDEYYKIAPPADAFVYVKKDFVTPIKAIAQVAGTPQAQKSPDELASANGTSANGTSGTPGNVSTPAEGAIAGAGSNPGSGSNSPAPVAPSTQPSGAEVAFDKLKSDFEAASSKPIEQQPLAELQTRCEKLIADPALPDSMRRIATFQLQTLKARVDAKQQFLALRKQQDQAKQRLASMKAEQQEISQQIKKNQVTVYTAVGLLRTSSLQIGKGLLYRLTDPQTGRTVCYIRSDDQKYGGMLDKFIGVKGAVATDPQLALKVVTPTDAAEVDPNQLYRQVAATIVPPSLLPPAQTASNQQ